MRWLWVPLVGLFAFLTVRYAVRGEYVGAIAALVVARGGVPWALTRNVS